MYSSDENLKIRLGKINFINTEPLYMHLDKEKYKLICGAPKKLFLLLKEKKVDVAPIPSFIYIKEFENINKIFKLLRGISVSSSTKVMSVCLFSKEKDIKKLKKIYITPLTSTSVELLKIILKKIGIKKIFFTQKKEGADALLLIGDEALFFKSKVYKYKLDLAKAWYDLYKLPFVFALFLFNKKKIKFPFFLKKDMILSKEKSLKNLEDLVYKVINLLKLNFSENLVNYLKDYYKSMNYDFSYKHYLSLKLFKYLSQEKNKLNLKSFKKKRVK